MCELAADGKITWACSDYIENRRKHRVLVEKLQAVNDRTVEVSRETRRTFADGFLGRVDERKDAQAGRALAALARQAEALNARRLLLETWGRNHLELAVGRRHE